ncbi:asparagine synthase (glutamine-hydrolyzing) [Algoriphagus sp. D3-2-R+10]|uniref:asparagine synthase (glutamine-hydrolyzing) n=1 Tax=Algoriphagus aurantiacus TaxID=3103948 RepID=UPI002B3E08DF|nr:asparagine synthase (glutamine-hydrolyzing) [Algoriphagus sp. D3-2-R+10]MEB2777534.1 asparagine synthase (glutamine-hydrolyzing) [Algoriphagus sp. D3-2-R+10]
MCGIAGSIGPNPSVRDVKSMCAAMIHRGPDNTGTFEDDNCILGQNRLSILDLSVAGNQPFYSEDGRYAMVFNGEIYNYIELKSKFKDHVFKSNSDTEVLLVAFQRMGIKALPLLNGMFSFAVWDKHLKKLTAVRDRFGVKPFYYGFKDENLYFASEIRPLFEVGFPKEPNIEVWSEYLNRGGYSVGDSTFWKGVTNLKPGHLLEWQESKLQVRKWYDFEQNIAEIWCENKPDPKSRIKELLLDSTRLRFRSDVPVGFNLSGGLDSSMLFALISNQFPEKTQIEAFTFYTGDERYDELSYVENLVKGSSYRLNKVKLSSGEVPDLADELVNNMSEPYGGLPTIAYSKLFKVANEKGFKVLLDGQGADEAWAGYDYYFNSNNSNVQGTNASPFRPGVLVPELRDYPQGKSQSKPFPEDLLNQQYKDIFNTKLQRALRFSDQMSMKYSTELREPFLDFRLVEEVFALPLELKRQGKIQKWLFREIAADFLTNSLRLAPKRPLQTPQREWLSQELQPWAMDHIQTLDKIGWFDMDKIQKEVDLFMKGNNDSSFHIWQWINTALIFK